MFCLTFPNNMVPSDDLAAFFLDAIIKDYIHLVLPLLSTNPNLLDAVERISEENPLFIAYKHGSLRVAEEIARRKPQLVGTKNKHGRHGSYNVMHLASCNGDVSFIKLLVEMDPQACLVEDNLSMIPLHICAMKGYEEAIRVLVDACPESLQRLTSQQETALHLAVKNYQCGAFEVLLKEIEKLQIEHLLNRKDNEGNTVLHIATSNKLTRIVQLLLPDTSTSTRRVVMRINSSNNNDRTALDVYYEISSDKAARKIGHILLEAGAVEGRSLSPQMPSTSQSLATLPRPLKARLLPSWTLETRNVLLVVLVMIVGAAFTVICNLPQGFSEETARKNATFYFMGVISGQLPTIFYLMVCITIAVLLSMGTIVVLIWSLPFGTVLFCVVATAFTAYSLILSKILPKFFVRIGTHDVPGSRFVWLLAITFILWGTAVTAIAKCLFSRLRPKVGVTANQMGQV